MMTVVDHVRPWLMPSSRFANRTQFQRRRPHEEEGHRNGDQPPRHQHVLATQTVRQSAGAVIGERLRHTEHHDERQHGRAGGELELLLRDRRQDAALQADHGADEGIDDDEQRELSEVLAKTQTHGAGGGDGDGVMVDHSRDGHRPTRRAIPARAIRARHAPGDERESPSGAGDRPHRAPSRSTGRGSTRRCRGVSAAPSSAWRGPRAAGKSRRE